MPATPWRARSSLASVVAAALAIIVSSGAFAQRVLNLSEGGAPSVQPRAAESVGMSSARLQLITKAFDQEIADRKLPGAVIMVARRGRLVYSRAFGVRDPAGSDPMRVDSIFRIYSMTKPMASVAAMLLVEDGILQPSDPVSKWLPPFKDIKVSAGGGDVASQRAMTVQDLLRHTAGLAYGELTQNQAVKEALASAGIYKPGVIDFDARDMTGAQQVERLAKIPLIHQPGSTWEYSLATDVLGRVVESASGKRLGEFLSERLFSPLRMKDTGFFAPAEKMNRLAQSYDKDPVTGDAFKLIDVSQQPGNDSGGAGAISTAPDYLRFAQMLLNGGALEGWRVLSPATIRYMASDHLGARISPASNRGGGVLEATAYTFGLGFAVRPGDGLATFNGSRGDYYWAGYAGTIFWVDPKEQIAAVLMVQSPGADRNRHWNMVRNLVYQSLIN